MERLKRRRHSMLHPAYIIILPRSQCGRAAFSMIFDERFFSLVFFLKCLIWWGLDWNTTLKKKSRSAQENEIKTHLFTHFDIVVERNMCTMMHETIIQSKELYADEIAPIHSFSNTVYNHFHIFVDTSFIYRVKAAELCAIDVSTKNRILTTP